MQRMDVFLQKKEGRQHDLANDKLLPKQKFQLRLCGNPRLGGFCVGNLLLHL